jgi:hypothetical protein
MALSNMNTYFFQHVTPADDFAPSQDGIRPCTQNVDRSTDHDRVAVIKNSLYQQNKDTCVSSQLVEESVLRISIPLARLNPQFDDLVQFNRALPMCPIPTMLLGLYSLLYCAGRPLE